MNKITGTLCLFGLVWLLGSCGGGGGAPAITDTVPPTISRVVVQPNNLLMPGFLVRVEADATDDSSGIDEVTVRVEYPNGATETHTLEAGVGSSYAKQFTASWTHDSPGIVKFTASARDKAGNTASASTREVRAGASPPPLPW